MAYQTHDCPEPPQGPSLITRIKQFWADVFNNVAVRVTTLIFTGVLVATGLINSAVMFVVQLLSQVFTSMPPVPILNY